MIEKILFFLGFKTWDTNFPLVKTRHVNMNVQKQKSNFKKVVEKMLTHDLPSPSPIMNAYITVNIDSLPTPTEKIKYSFYILYSFLVFLFLCIQPIYLIVKMSNKFSEELLVTFFMAIINPVNYIWGKYYFTTNHYSSMIKYDKYKSVSIIVSSLISIGLHFIDIKSFDNDFYWTYLLPKPLMYTFIILEWFYSRMLYLLIITVFTCIFCYHISSIKNFIKMLETDKFNFNNSTCLSELISIVSELRYKVEISISYFNTMISYVTILGGLAIAISIRNKMINFRIYDHERYLIHGMVFYVITQLVFFTNIVRYSFCRGKLLKHIDSVNFINRFLCRYDLSKIKKRYKNDLIKLILNFEEENATTIDWMVLNKLLDSKWMNFTIMGISTQDGALLKKVITISALIISVVKYF